MESCARGQVVVLIREEDCGALEGQEESSFARGLRQRTFPGLLRGQVFDQAIEAVPCRYCLRILYSDPRIEGVLDLLQGQCVREALGARGCRQILG